MRIILFFDKEKQAYSLMIYNKIVGVDVCVNLTAEQAEKFKRVLTDIDEDEMLVYYRPKFIKGE